MRFTMSTTEEKKSSDVPSFVIAQPESSSAAAGKKSKRNIIIAVIGVVVVALVLTAILVGMYLFTEAEKDLVKVTMQLKNNITQEISSNPNTNVVQFHVKDSIQETWTVNDYNSDLKVIKIQTATETNCFVTALNESAPVDIPKMNSGGQDNAGSVEILFTTSGTPIKDNSFISKTARDMCSGVSTYWLYPKCGGPVDNHAPNTTLSSNDRQKRQIVYYFYYNGYYYVSACYFYITYTYQYNYYYCYPTYGYYYCYVVTLHCGCGGYVPLYRYSYYIGGYFYSGTLIGYC